MAFSTAAYAGDPRCNAPPYGGTVPEYKAIVANFGQIVVPTRVLSSVCNAKFSGTPRTALYNLGFTDAEIDAKDTEDLAVDMLNATKLYWTSLAARSDYRRSCVVRPICGPL
jgi:hypothetical protein